MAQKKKFSNVPQYYREGHYTGAHKRQLNDSGMMLELAQGGDSFKDYLEFVLVPDPLGKNPPVFVREDQLLRFSDADYNRILNFIAPINSRKQLSRIVSRRSQMRSFLNDDYNDYNSGSGSGTTVEDIAGYVDLALDLYNLFFGDNNSGGTTSSGVSMIGTNGFLYALKNIGGNNTGFGISPDGYQLIAFSSPEEAKKYFPQWDQFTTVPQLPASVPAALIQKALSRANTIVSIATNPAPGGGGVPPGGGDPGSYAGIGSGVLLPLLLIGGLAYIGLKK